MFWGKSTVTDLSSTFLITGCDTGFGHILAKDLAGKGYIVYAGCLTENAAKELENQKKENLIPIIIDVTKQSDIDAAVAKIEKEQGNLFCLINNAGMLNSFWFEWTTIEQAEEMFQVNYFGQVRMCKAFIPLLRKKKHSRILNVSSMASFLYLPGLSGYNATKAALRAFSATLRQELRFFGIQVATIMPGGFKTPIQSQTATIEKCFRRSAPEIQQAYGEDFMEGFKESWEQTQKFQADPTVCTNRILEIALSTNASGEFPIGGDAWTMYHFFSGLSTSLQEQVLSKAFGKLSVGWNKEIV
jgi:NAD(P)-dependent dehydrogenase (short-subunit alcohol dehydrogenase family)